MDIAEGVVNFIESAAPVHRLRDSRNRRKAVEAIAEQAGIAEQQHRSARDIDAALGSRYIAPRRARMIRPACHGRPRGNR